jgi:hypothetical protein
MAELAMRQSRLAILLLQWRNAAGDNRFALHTCPAAGWQRSGA